MKNNNNFRHKAVRTAFLLVFLLSAFPTLQAQEYIKEVAEHPTDYTIVREYKPDSRIVYNFHSDNNAIISEFLLVTESGTTTSILQLTDDAIMIYDFEIYHDTLYFCGAYDYNGYSRGFMGFFRLSSFPTTNVYSHYSQSFQYFSKMELVNSMYGGPLHIVMTGRTIDSNPCLIDAPKPSGGPWTFYYIDGSFDDVAMTSNRVIATYHRRTGDQEGGYYFFSHPSPGGLIFYGQVYRIILDSNIATTMLLEAEDGDYYSVAYNRTNGAYAEIKINRLYGLGNTYSCITLPVVNSNYYPLELKYNSLDTVLDILCTDATGTITNSIIYHRKTWFLYGRHHFDNQRITSIEYLRNDPHCFFATGGCGNGYLWLYKNSSLNINPVCSWYDIPKYIISKKKPSLIEENPTIRSATDFLGVVNKETTSNPIEIKCYYNMDEENNVEPLNQ